MEDLYAMSEDDQYCAIWRRVRDPTQPAQVRVDREFQVLALNPSNLSILGCAAVISASVALLKPDPQDALSKAYKDFVERSLVAKKDHPQYNEYEVFVARFMERFAGT